MDEHQDTDDSDLNQPVNESDQQSEHTPLDKHETEPVAEFIKEDIDTIEFDNNPETDLPLSTAKAKRHRFPRPESIFPSKLKLRLGRKARPLGSLIILLVIGLGIFGYWHYVMLPTAEHSGETRFKAKAVAFEVVTTTPSKDQANVNPAAPITVTFNEPVDPQKLSTSFFVSPTVAGKYSQGSNKDQVTFTPATAFARGTKVQVMINGTFQSQTGSKLGADYFYGFTTSIPDSGVLFQDKNGLIDTLSSIATGQKISYSLLVGPKVISAKITLYKGDLTTLLNSLIYHNQTIDGFTSQQFASQYVDTSGLKVISTTANIQNNQSYGFSQPDGIYLAVATDPTGKQLGYVWIDETNFGVLLRQDDQKLVLDAQSFSDNSDIAATVDLYNLNNGINKLGEQQVKGITSINSPLKPSVDVVVASYGGEQAIVPVSILNSQGDIRADKNLSTAQTFFALTDKPTYSSGDVVHLAGFVRQDNDAQYTVPYGGVLKLYVADPNGSEHLADFTANISSQGTFSVDIPTSNGWLTNGDKLNQFQIYAKSPDGNQLQDVNLASFTLTNQAASSSNVTVKFSKSSYLPSDNIQAVVKAVDSKGQPMSGATADVHIFSKDYYENDPGENLTSFGSTGMELNGSPSTVTLDANGQATVSIPTSELPNSGYSQEVTIQANIHGNNGAGAAGGDSAIVHQGNGVLSFGMGRTVVAPGGNLVGRLYATQLDGSPLANAVIKYQLVNSSDPNQTVVASGVVNADNSGFASVNINLPSSIQQGASLILKASTSDTNNNQIQAQNYYYIADPSGAEDYSGAQLGQLDVSGSSGNVKVGDNVNLTINAPRDMRVMMTMDRGRIYNPKMLNLKAGDNNLSFTVTKDLAPSFTITFGYFHNGTYHSEGTSFNVSEPEQQAAISLSTTNSTYSANTPVTININAKDNQGNPLATNLIVDVVDSGAYDLSNPVVPAMYDSLYSPRVLMTSSTSSLTNIGSGGGKCGGGGFGAPSFSNALGTTLLWQPDLTTDQNGQAAITFNPPKGSWQVSVYSMDGNTTVGSATKTIVAD